MRNTLDLKNEFESLHCFKNKGRSDLEIRSDCLNELFIKLSMIDFNHLERELKEDIFHIINSVYLLSLDLFKSKKIKQSTTRDLFDLFNNERFKYILNHCSFLLANKRFEQENNSHLKRDILLKSYNPLKNTSDIKKITQQAYTVFEKINELK